MNREIELPQPTIERDPLRRRSGRRRRRRSAAPVLLAIALGGGTGALARYGLAQLLPAASGGFPWATFVTNVLGCMLIGVLMVLVGEVWAAHRLLRPFLGVGLLGGFTTFSTYAVEFDALLRAGSVLLAFGYLVATLVSALFAVVSGVLAARLLTSTARRANTGS